MYLDSMVRFHSIKNTPLNANFFICSRWPQKATVWCSLAIVLLRLANMNLCHFSLGTIIITTIKFWNTKDYILSFIFLLLLTYKEIFLCLLLFPNSPTDGWLSFCTFRKLPSIWKYLWPQNDKVPINVKKTPYYNFWKFGQSLVIQL